MRLFMKEQIQTESYISDYGYLVIKQPENNGNYESSVFLSPSQIESIMEMVKGSQLQMIELWETEQEEEITEYKR